MAVIKPQRQEQARNVQGTGGRQCDWGRVGKEKSDREGGGARHKPGDRTKGLMGLEADGCCF